VVSQTWDETTVAERLDDDQIAALARLRIQLGQHDDTDSTPGERDEAP
jgi:hypothetical protein